MQLWLGAEMASSGKLLATEGSIKKKKKQTCRRRCPGLASVLTSALSVPTLLQHPSPAPKSLLLGRAQGQDRQVPRWGAG